VSDETLVSAADIARLADVGRSAVSNWRRRYADFPRPAGGTPAVPLFALDEVEAWLRDQGRLLEVPLAERAWQELRARAGDDLRLAAALAEAGELLARGQGTARAGSPAVAELAAALGPADAFDALFGRLTQMWSRSPSGPHADVAELMAALAGQATTVLDPACGTGEILLAAAGNGARRLFGQDPAADSARLAAIRLRLVTAEANQSEITIRAEDGLLRDAFPGLLADAVLSDLTLNKRSGMPEADPSDPRWVFGVPPRLEPELAWAQHMIAHLSPGGLAAALLPAAAAARRPGRRIRAQLLRKGALRAVIALSPAYHLWLLHRSAAGPPDSVLMMAASDAQAVIATWRRFTTDPAVEEPGVSRAVPVIDLLDDEVDLTPGRYITAPAAEHAAEQFSQVRARLSALLGGLAPLAPELRPTGQPRRTAVVTVAELARLGHLQVHHAPIRGDLGTGPDAVLTAEDVVEGRPASGCGLRDPRWTAVRSGDIVVATAAGRFAARVWDADDVMLGPALTLVRVDQARLDAHFVAGALRSSGNARVSMVQTGSTGRGSLGRADVLRAQIPLLPLAEQRGYGDAFRRVAHLQAAVRSADVMAAELARLLADGVTGGTFEPPEIR
jgi:SAM-dependent methyltransferase